MTAIDYVPRVLANTPPWVWGVLVLLVVLGVRRLKPRRTHLALAALAPLAFIVWSLTGTAIAARGSAGLVAAVWAGALVLGALTVFVHRGRRPMPLGGATFLFPATATPLGLYMLVFWARYGLAVWSAFQPALALELTLAAIAISAATAGRFAADFVPLLRAAIRPAGFAPDTSGPT